MISNTDKCKYLHILEEINSKSANIYTNKDISEALSVSTRKIVDFKHGKVIDFWLLTQYGAMIGLEIEFNIKLRYDK